MTTTTLAISFIDSNNEITRSFILGFLDINLSGLKILSNLIIWYNKINEN